jgi:dipeptidyl aminopeptidase/acylaminoacyl peptidase
VAQTDSPERHSVPLWSPDGTRIAFLSTKDQTIMVQRMDGSGTPEVLARFDHHLGYPLSWQHDTLALVDYGRRVSERISLLPLKESPSEVPVAKGMQPAISPNGRWLAYTNAEIIVQDMEDTRSVVRVSRGGGVEPRWRADGKELFFRNRGGQFFAVTMSETRGGMSAGEPRALFRLQHNTFLMVEHAYDVTPDGQRFLVMKPVEPPPTQVNVVLGWREELERLVP